MTDTQHNISEPEPEIVNRWRASHLGWTIASAVALLLVVAYSAATLVDYPPVNSNEGQIAATVSSWIHGGGNRPTVYDGSGIYDGTTSWWQPYIGPLPLAIAELVGPTTLTTYRLSAFITALLALLLFAFAVRRRHGVAAGLAGAAALALTWGFFATSHYVRWDATAFLWLIGVLAVLWWRAPSAKWALAVGVLLGTSPDIQLSVVALFPGAALLIGWEADGRWRRISVFFGGFALCVATYYAVHVLPNPAESRQQFKDFAAPGYKVPLLSALLHGDFEPLSQQKVRYDLMTAGWPIIKAQTWCLVLLVGGYAAALWTLARARREYPAAAVPGILLIGYIPGLALIQGNYTNSMYAWFAVPLAIAALTEAVVLAGRTFKWPVPARDLAAGLLLALTLVGFLALDHDRKLPQQAPITDRPVLAAAVTRELRPNDVVIGETPYWWLVRDERFRSNSLLWFAQWKHGDNFEQSFARACPSLVILDDQWWSHYGYGPSSPFPNLNPTRPAEREQVRPLLRRDYQLRRSLKGAGWWAELWRRKSPCRDSRPGAAA